MYIRKISIFYALLLIIFIAGCSPPMFSQSRLNIKSPDGQTSLAFISRTLYGVGVIGPEPPKVVSCKGIIMGYSKYGHFKLSLSSNYAPNLWLFDLCDITWSKNSNFFSLITPGRIAVYNTKGKEIFKHALNKNKRCSSIHWREDKKNSFYMVIKYKKNIIDNFFSPEKTYIFSVSIPENNLKKIITINHSDSWEFNVFDPTTLMGKKTGQEFQEISPNSRFFIYTNRMKVKLYDFHSKAKLNLFDLPGDLSGVWWLTNNKVLLYFYLLKEDEDIYLLFNTNTSHVKNITEKVKQMKEKDQLSIYDWYKAGQPISYGIF